MISGVYSGARFRLRPGMDSRKRFGTLNDHLKRTNTHMDQNEIVFEMRVRERRKKPNSSGSDQPKRIRFKNIFNKIHYVEPDLGPELVLQTACARLAQESLRTHANRTLHGHQGL